VAVHGTNDLSQGVFGDPNKNYVGDRPRGVERPAARRPSNDDARGDAALQHRARPGVNV